MIAARARANLLAKHTEANFNASAALTLGSNSRGRRLESRQRETSGTAALQFNQLQKRQKSLKFMRSPIHGWGLFAMEVIDGKRGALLLCEKVYACQSVF